MIQTLAASCGEKEIVKMTTWRKEFEDVFEETGDTFETVNQYWLGEVGAVLTIAFGR